MSELRNFSSHSDISDIGRLPTKVFEVVNSFDGFASEDHNGEISCAIVVDGHKFGLVLADVQ